MGKLHFILLIVISMLLYACKQPNKANSTNQAENKLVKVDSTRMGNGRINFPYDSLLILQQLYQSKAIIKWVDKLSIYDSVFNRSVESPDTFEAGVLTMDTIKKGNSLQIIALLYLRPAEWECHACGPLLEACFYEQKSSGQTQLKNHIPLDLYGTFGYPPDVWFIRFKNGFGYRIETGFTGQGITVGSTILYRNKGSYDLVNALEINPSFDDNSGMCDSANPNIAPKCYSYQTTITTDTSGMMLTAHKKGTVILNENVVDIDTVFEYNFSNSKYYLTKTIVHK